MAKINLKNKEIECKVVYYGPGRCGKTTNLEYIFGHFRKNVTGKMVTAKTEGDRTLFFDFLPMGIGKIKGYDVRLHLYTVPGQVKYASTRKMVLREVDGVVFVADSLKVRREKNVLSLKDLHRNLKDYGLNIMKVPLVMQYNKRDLGKQGLPILPIAQLEKDLNRQLKAPAFPAAAISGHGVGQTLQEIIKVTLKYLKTQLSI